MEPLAEVEHYVGNNPFGVQGERRQLGVHVVVGIEGFYRELPDVFVEVARIVFATGLKRSDGLGQYLAV